MQYAEGQKGSLVLLFVFTPLDCELSTEPFKQLSALHTSRRVAVVGVMVDPPPTAATRAKLVSAFGPSFPVDFDAAGRWRDALRQAAKDRPLLIITRRNRVQAVLAGVHAKHAISTMNRNGRLW